MTRDETVALWQRCQDARVAAIALGKTDDDAHHATKAIWNGWSNELLERKAQLERFGLWQAAYEWDEKWHIDRYRASCPETLKWLDEASCDFSGHTFDTDVNFSGIVFPGEAIFGQPDHNNGESTRFNKTANFHAAFFHATAQFANTKFLDVATFSRTNFFGPARFANAQFNKSAEFQEAKFHNKVRFGGSKYLEFSRFDNATFLDDANFQNCSFMWSGFQKAKFNKGVDFYEAQFNGYAGFSGAKFIENEAVFAAIISQKLFDLSETYFELVPNFTQASFKEAPNLDEIKLDPDAEPGNFWRSCLKASTPHVIVKYRALRRLAVLGHDHHNEQKFLKWEIRARRNNIDKFWHAAFWFGVMYDALSDFGRSITRPFYVWLFSLLAFAVIYFVNAGVRTIEWLTPCAGDGASKVLRAITLSAVNALPLIGSSRNDAAKTFYSCISLQTVPEWSPIIQIGQTVWSAVLIFLFLLAVRSQFKIK